MFALLTNDESKNLFTFIKHCKNPRKNMHTRNIVNKREWEYLNGMKHVNGVIKGHVYYSNGVELSYQINDDGTFSILSTNNIQDASKAPELLKSMKNKIIEVVNRGYSDKKIIRIKRTAGQYYLVRHSWGLTKTAKAAIKSGDLSEGFLNQMANWELCLIKGKQN